MRVIAIALLAALTGCVPTPESYPVPPQHSPFPGPEKLAHPDYVSAADPGAESYFTKDVKSLEGAFRWTHGNPEFRFFLRKIQNRTFKLEFGIHPLILTDVRVFEMTIRVNEHLLATVRHKTAGNKVFEKRVPESWLILNGDNLVNIQVHHPWQTPDKNVHLGFVFFGAGFIE